jgi:hypothetical protein
MHARVILLVIVLFSLQIVAGQKILDSISVHEFPVREGIIFIYDETSFHCSQMPAVSIYSQFDSVFHFENGKVMGVFNLGDCYAVVIQNDKGEYITYSNFKAISIRKGESIKRGDFVGTLLQDEDDQKNSLDIIISKEIKYLPQKKLLEYIQCNISSKVSNNYTLYVTPSSANSVFRKTSRASVSNSSSVSYLLLK